MLATLIPLFDEKMSVRAYSLFTQKKNFLLNPSFQGTGSNDGASSVTGLEVIENMGLESVSAQKEVFVAVNNISVFSDALLKSTLPHERLVLLTDNSIEPQDIYVNRLRSLKETGYKLAIRKLPVQSFEEYREILLLMDYIFLDHKKIDIHMAQIYFQKVYPNIKLCAGNIQTQEIFEQLDKPYISGITFSGGDPLHAANRMEIRNLMAEIKEKYPGKTIWLYTGDSWENIYHYSLMKYVDVLVDGEFQAERKDVKLLWKGSSNQRVIDVQKSLQLSDYDNPVLHCGDYGS